MYGDCLIVHLMFSEQLLRHPLQTHAAGLHAVFIFSIIPVNKIFGFLVILEIFFFFGFDSSP